MIPNLFRKIPIPNHIPKELEKKIQEFQTKNKEDFLKSAFNVLAKKYRLRRFDVLLNIFHLWNTDVEKLWHQKGHIHCTSLNYLLRIMLVKSGLFNDDNIELKLTNSWFVMIHQYLRIKVSENKYVNVDPWNYSFGIPYGKFGHGFHSGSILPKRK